MAASAGANSRFQVGCRWIERGDRSDFSPAFIGITFNGVAVQSTITVPIGGVLEKGSERSLKFHILKQDGSQADCESLRFTAQQIHSMVFNLDDFKTKVFTPRHILDGVDYELWLNTDNNGFKPPVIVEKDTRIRNNVILSEGLIRALGLGLHQLDEQISPYFHANREDGDYFTVVYNAISEVDEATIEATTNYFKQQYSKISQAKSVDDLALLMGQMLSFLNDKGILLKITESLAKKKKKEALTAADQAKVQEITTAFLQRSSNILNPR